MNWALRLLLHVKQSPKCRVHCCKRSAKLFLHMGVITSKAPEKVVLAVALLGGISIRCARNYLLKRPVRVDTAKRARAAVAMIANLANCSPDSEVTVDQADAWRMLERIATEVHRSLKAGTC